MRGKVNAKRAGLKWQRECSRAVATEEKQKEIPAGQRSRAAHTHNPLYPDRLARIHKHLSKYFTRIRAKEMCGNGQRKIKQNYRLLQ